MAHLDVLGLRARPRAGLVELGHPRRQEARSGEPRDRHAASIVGLPQGTREAELLDPMVNEGREVGVGARAP